MRLIFLGILLGLSYSAHAVCPLPHDSSLSLENAKVRVVYQGCAEGMNDDYAQARLAAFYDKGAKSTPRELSKALYYYQLSADNGNAVSQARLAELYVELDKNAQGRKVLHDYLDSVVSMSDETKKANTDDIWVSLTHPYVLLLLANEKPEGKWYYPTEQKVAPEKARNLLGQYKVDAARKRSYVQQASAWKQKKLLEIAKQVLSGAE